MTTVGALFGANHSAITCRLRWTPYTVFLQLRSSGSCGPGFNLLPGSPFPAEHTLPILVGTDLYWPDLPILVRTYLYWPGATYSIKVLVVIQYGDYLPSG